jgi:hypothetical protein
VERGGVCSLMVRLDSRRRVESGQGCRKVDIDTYTIPNYPFW